jgi:type I restriction enzyme R subunit
MRNEHERLAATGLSEEELAFYDAVVQNDAAVLQLGDDVLKAIVRELVDLMQKEATVDWRYRETVRAAMRVKIKRLLRKHGYPPDKQAAAVDLVIEQAELFADELTAA